MSTYSGEPQTFQLQRPRVTEKHYGALYSFLKIHKTEYVSKNSLQSLDCYTYYRIEYASDQAPSIVGRIMASHP